mmetsp:Transcript_33330/g.33945  ORF Transcript_33330/g.33945 Transcript_33330/m.33945 type:complete len:232 (-) Transcript_33330:158-853(-)
MNRLCFALCLGFITSSLSMSLRLFFRQAINTQALYSISCVASNPSLCVPHHHISKLNKLSIEDLKARGIKGIIFDKDNTLTTTYSDELHPSVQNIVTDFQHNFSPGIAILSNSIGSSDDPHYQLANSCEEALNIPVIRHLKKKPACIEEVLTHFREVFGQEVHSSELCMIGDRVLTDIVFGNMHNMTTVLVHPLSHMRDHPIATIIRIFETRLLLPIIRLGLKWKKPRGNC